MKKRAAPKARKKTPARGAPAPTPAAPDPPPWLPEFDLYLFGEGTHQRLYERMGAQVVTHQGVPGVHFAVWAPNATSVSVIGDHNGWDAGADPMRLRGATGVWELFVPGLGPGALYKFEIGTAGGRSTIKADPYGSYMELRPNTASVVYDLGRYTWGDGDWMAGRAGRSRSTRCTRARGSARAARHPIGLRGASWPTSSCPM